MSGGILGKGYISNKLRDIERIGLINVVTLANERLRFRLWQRIQHTLGKLMRRNCGIKYLPAPPLEEKHPCQSTLYKVIGDSYILIPTGNAFNVKAGQSYADAILYVYNQYCQNSKTIPLNLSDAIYLYWYENPRKKEDSCGYAGIITDPNTQEKAIFLAYRGTETSAEWLNNIDFFQTKIGFKNTERTGLVSKGFWDIYTKAGIEGKPPVQDQARDAVGQLLKKDPTLKKIIIVGHSLGAAIATLTTVDLALYFPECTIVNYTFGCPRVGDQTFTESLRSLNTAEEPDRVTLWRVANSSDLVPQLPLAVMPTGILYEHVAARVNLDNISSIGFVENHGSYSKNHALDTYYKGMNPLPSFKQRK